MGPLAGPCFSVQLGSEDGDVCRRGLGLEERKIKGAACFLSRSGCAGLAESRKGREDEEEGGREGPTSNPQPGAKATSTHCRLQLHTP